MKKISTTFVFALMLGVLLWSPAAVLAGEHGGQEAAGGEHGGTAMEGSHSQGNGDAAILQKAASILKAAHPDLAAELEAVAAGE